MLKKEHEKAIKLKANNELPVEQKEESGEKSDPQRPGKYQAADPFSDLREPDDLLYEDPEEGRRWFPLFVRWFR